MSRIIRFIAIFATFSMLTIWLLLVQFEANVMSSHYLRYEADREQAEDMRQFDEWLRREQQKRANEPPTYNE